MTARGRRIARHAVVAGLALLMGSAGASAQGLCPSDHERMAMQTAAVQQELMVAALTCRRTQRYNAFVLRYRADLIGSDRRLKGFFVRRDGAKGNAAYHSFKTRLANAASLDSLHQPDYCTRADEIFSRALDGPTSGLAALMESLLPLAPARCGAQLAANAMGDRN